MFLKREAGVFRGLNGEYGGNGEYGERALHGMVREAEGNMKYER